MQKNKCNEKDCKKVGFFNLINESYGIYCSEHRKENMIDIKHRRCLEDNCKSSVS